MKRTNISSGSHFEESIGYSRAVMAGNMIFVSGTTGFDYATKTISTDIVEQTEQTIKNIIAALQECGAMLHDIVRVHYILQDASDFESCWPILKKYFDGIRPAATMFEAKLADPRMKIEIEVTAIKGT